MSKEISVVNDALFLPISRTLDKRNICMLNQNVVCAILSLTLAITRVRESESWNDEWQRASDLSSINCFNSVFADINFSTNTRYNFGISLENTTLCFINTNNIHVYLFSSICVPCHHSYSYIRLCRIKMSTCDSKSIAEDIKNYLLIRKTSLRSRSAPAFASKGLASRIDRLIQVFTLCN